MTIEVKAIPPKFAALHDAARNFAQEAASWELPVDVKVSSIDDDAQRVSFEIIVNTPGIECHLSVEQVKSIPGADRPITVHPSSEHRDMAHNFRNWIGDRQQCRLVSGATIEALVDDFGRIIDWFSEELKKFRQKRGSHI